MTLPNIDTAQSDSSYRDVPNVSCGFARSGDALKRHFPDLVVSKQNPACGRDRLCPPEASGGESKSRVCLPSFRVMRTPVKRPHDGQFLYERRNGHFLLQVTGHPSYGLPWGQDRLVPIFLATLTIRQQNRVNRLRSAAEMLATFGTQQGGTQYRRLMAASRQLKVEPVSELHSRRVSQRFSLDVRDSTRD